VANEEEKKTERFRIKEERRINQLACRKGPLQNRLHLRAEGGRFAKRGFAEPKRQRGGKMREIKKTVGESSEESLTGNLTEPRRKKNRDS